MTDLGKRIVAGALIAIGGAFVWAVPAFAWTGRQTTNFIFESLALAAYAVLMTSWFVLPIGGILGAVMPRVVRGSSQGQAFWRGLLLGLLVRILAAVLTTVMMEWPMITGSATIVNTNLWSRGVYERFFFYASTMCVVCGPWVAVWAMRWNPRAKC